MPLQQARILGCLIALCAIAPCADTAQSPSKQALKRFADGERHESQGQRQQAIDDYSEAIQLSPDYAAAIYHRAKLYLDLGDKKKALPDLNAAIRLMPKDTKPLVLHPNLYRPIVQPSH